VLTDGEILVGVLVILGIGLVGAAFGLAIFWLLDGRYWRQ
jgi:hypothetical protein